MASAQTEPSMDEILASIRRIISEEDDAPDVPVRQKLETLHLADDVPSVEEVAEAVSDDDAEDVKEEAEAGEPAAQIREVAREEDQPEAKAPAKAEKAPADEKPASKTPESKASESKTPAPEKSDSEEPASKADKPKAEGAAEDLDDFAPLPEAPAPAGATMEPAAEAHDQGETHDDTFDETPDAVSEAAPKAEATGGHSGASQEDNIRQLADAVRPAVMAEAVQKTTLNAGAARQAADAFGALEENVRISTGQGRTMEDLVEQMLAPMLSAWLDDNLPRIVEDKVEEEVRRIARRR